MMNSRPIVRASQLYIRFYATGTSTTPPMLLKIRYTTQALPPTHYLPTIIEANRSTAYRKDMKTAMQSKDSNRLSVLRALLSQTLNASKTSSPINTDMQMLALLRKSANAAKAASEEFKGAGRQDLADKEDLQRSIMEEYVSGVEVLGEGEIRSAVESVIEGLKGEANGKEIKVGDVLKAVFKPEVLGDKPVEKGDVARIAKELLK